MLRCDRQHLAGVLGERLRGGGRTGGRAVWVSARPSYYLPRPGSFLACVTRRPDGVWARLGLRGGEKAGSSDGRGCVSGDRCLVSRLRTRGGPVRPADNDLFGLIPPTDAGRP